MDSTTPYDAILLVSFGGPEKRDDVMPFLENVTRGRSVPRERLLEVAEHYYRFDGVSPINAQNRALLAALRALLDSQGPALPLYWGNRNWQPLLTETVARMADDGIRRALAFVTSAFASYSSCRQYLEDIARARAEVGARAPVIDKLRLYWDHPGFIEPMVEHTVPRSTADTSAYVAQLEEASGLVAARLRSRHPWALAFQSRSGPPSQPWLEPDIRDHLAALRARGVTEVVLVPIGFVSDHLEVQWDLDLEAAARARELGMRLTRAATVGTHPGFVAMIRELVRERTGDAPRLALGRGGPAPDVCAPGCCLAPARPPMAPAAPRD